MCNSKRLSKAALYLGFNDDDDDDDDNNNNNNNNKPTFVINLF